MILFMQVLVTVCLGGFLGAIICILPVKTIVMICISLIVLMQIPKIYLKKNKGKNISKNTKIVGVTLKTISIMIIGTVILVKPLMLINSREVSTQMSKIENTKKVKKEYPEYELIAIKIVQEEKTDNWGRIIDHEEHLLYSFVDSNGNIYHKNRYFEGEQKERYRLHKSIDGKSKIVDKSSYSNASLDFYISEELFKDLY